MQEEKTDHWKEWLLKHRYGGSEESQRRCLEARASARSRLCKVMSRLIALAILLGLLSVNCFALQKKPAVRCIKMPDIAAADSLSIRDISFCSDSVGFALCMLPLVHKVGIYRTVSHAQHWSKLLTIDAPEESFSNASITAVSASRALLILQDSIYEITSARGAFTITAINNSLSKFEHSSPSKIQLISPSQIYMSDYRRLLLSSDSGKSWSQVFPSIHIDSILAHAVRFIFADQRHGLLICETLASTSLLGSSREFLFSTADAGRTWKYAGSVDGWPSSIGFVGAHGHSYYGGYYTTNNGATWRTFNENTKAPYRGNSTKIIDSLGHTTPWNIPIYPRAVTPAGVLLSVLGVDIIVSNDFGHNWYVISHNSSLTIPDREGFLSDLATRIEIGPAQITVVNRRIAYLFFNRTIFQIVSE